MTAAMRYTDRTTHGGNMATTALFDETEDLLDIRKDNIFKGVFLII